MSQALVQELRDQIRGVAGALLIVGLTFHYTIETWWLGWTLPLPYLVTYAAVGLALIMALARTSGFREQNQNENENENGQSESPLDVATTFAEILLQSFVASYTILLVLGIIDVRSSLNLVMRLGLIEVVPLGFGAALANHVFAGEGEARGSEGKFPQNVPIFAVGALFIASTIAPTQEMELIAVHMSWFRHALLVALTLVLVYFVLFELEFKGQQARVSGALPFQIGTTFIVYFVGAAVSFFLLAGFGHFIGAGLPLMYQETTVLAFPASLGGAAAEVLI